jgi:hypothetical protein
VTDQFDTLQAMTLVPPLWHRCHNRIAVMFLLVGLGGLLLFAWSKAERELRPPFEGVTSINVAPFSGSRLPTSIVDGQRLAALLNEVNFTRTQNWRAFRGKVGACSTVLKLLGHDSEVGRLFVTINPLTLVELQGKSAHFGFYIRLSEGAAPLLESAASGAGQSSKCSSG